MQRTAPRLTRLLACAAVVPVTLVAGCSAGPGGQGSGSSPEKTKSSTQPKPAAAKYADLPRPCHALSASTVRELVPNAKQSRGIEGKTSDTTLRGSCSWNGLDGYQFRWLDISFQRFESNSALGAGEKRAQEYFTKQVENAKPRSGAKGLKTAAVNGLGDEAKAVQYSTAKDGDTFRNQVVVVRTANIVFTVNYNGAGYEDADSPDASKMLARAKDAAKNVEAATVEANKGGSSDKDKDKDAAAG
ncbi:DUF3558 family protein [Streptomyces meridianus]|uniref:DUF3558 family protein n=1 Tax=Streptomyces meridianus TaxID=2938945 RepID=A0ABT0X6Y7_9ACTN|nr:DUF3558 family protein [Streptomyces meridianus]MCM2578290.1 DUF3558 family protein [Streptomyces meridianus]